MKNTISAVLFITLLFAIGCRQDEPIVIKGDTTITTTDQTAIFAKSFGSNVSDLVTAARQTIDGGVVVCGYTIASQFGDNDIFITKLDDSSNVVWSKIIGGPGNDLAVYMDTTFDGGFIICGSTNSFSGTFDPFAMKIDNSGNILWANYYFWWGDDQGAYITPTADYGYIMTGGSNSQGAGGYDAYSLKIDASGSIMWCRSYGGLLDDFGAAIRQAPDGGYVIAGNTFSFGNAGEIFTIKIFGDGGYSWSKSYGSLGVDNVRDMAAVSGGFVMCGSTTSFGVAVEDGYLLSIDNNGFLFWSRTFGGLLGEDDRFYSIKSITTGGIIVSGYMKNTGGSSEDYIVLRLFSDGAFNWLKSSGGVGTDAATSVALNRYGGYIVGGYTSSYGAGANDPYILSIKSDGTGCLQSNNVTPNGGDPMTEVFPAAVIYNSIDTYQTNAAGFSTANNTFIQNMQCLTGP